MELKILSNTDNKSLINIENEDIAIADIIHHEILNDVNVIFAGIMQKHPLIKRITISIQTKNIKPLDVILSNSLNAVNKVDEINSELKKYLLNAEES